MDDEQQNENQEPDLGEQITQSAKKQIAGAAKREGKNLAKKGARKAAKGAAQGAKQVGAAVGKAFAALPLPAKIAVIVVLAFIIIFVVALLAGSDDYLDGENVTTTDEVTYQTVQEYCTIDETGIHIKKEELLENLIKRLNENNIDLNELGLGDDGSYKVIGNNTIGGDNSIIEGFDPNSQAANFLYKFISAALVGEFPYIEGSDEEVQGIIKVKRKTAKNENEAKKEAKDLIFIGYDKFQEMLQTHDSAVKDEMMNYFTLDENWNLCIVKPYTKTVNTYSHGQLVSSVIEYTISEVKIPYRDMVAQYTVPFLFLIDLQIVTHNANYVEAVAELMSKRSEIEFTIFDQFTTNTNQYNYTAKRHVWNLEEIGTSGETGIIGGAHQKEWQLREFPVDETTEIIIETDNVKASVTKAKTWIIEQETNYEMQVTREYPYGENGTTNTLPPQDPINTPPGSWDTERSEHLYTEILKREWVKSGDTKTLITPSEFMGLWANETGTYVKGAPYKAVGDGKVGKVVNHRRLNSTTEGDPVVVNIVGSELALCELLESSVTTQVHAELMREMIRVYKESEELTEDTFYTSAFTSMYEPFEFIEGSYVGNFDVHDESLFITDLETLKRALAGGYTYGDKLVQNAEAFLEMQKKYKVNAIFAASVSITETGAGRTGHAVDGCNNWFNIKGTSSGNCHRTVDKKGNVSYWRIFPTIQDGIDAFGWNIAEGSNYYTQGRYTVGDIGKVYCPDTAEHPTQAEDWIEATMAQISRFYEAVGIDISPIVEGTIGSDYGYDIPTEALTDTQFKAMWEEAQKYLGMPYVWGGSSPQTGFDCSGFVCWVINHSIGDVGRTTANGLRKHCAYVSKEQAKPGDLIFFQKTYATSGASHVGIYIGDGKMIHCGDPIQVTSIETPYWQNHFLDFGRLQ